MKHIGKLCFTSILCATLGVIPAMGNAQDEVKPDAPASATAGKGAKDAAEPNISFGDYLAGKFAQSSGDNKKSIRFLRESLTKDPNNKDIILNLYHAYIESGDVENALPLAKKLESEKLTDEGNEFPLQMVLAIDAAKNKHYDDAERYIQQIPKTGFNTLLVPLLSSWIKFGKGEIKTPIDAKDILPNSKMLLSNISLNCAFLNELAGFSKEAGEQYEAAAKENQLDSMRAAEAYVNYLQRNNQKDKAVQFATEYKKAHGETVIEDEIASSKVPEPLVKDANEGMAEALFTMASIFHGVRTPSDEITTLRLALYLRPDFPAAQFLIGGSYELTRSFKEAIDSYDRIKPGVPYFVQSQIMAAYDKNELGNKAEAISELDKIANDNPNTISALLAKGDIQRTSNEFKAAIQSYDEAIARIKTPERTQWIVYFSRGICYDRTGRFEKTEQDMKKALELSPDEPNVLNYLGYSWLLKHKNLADARKMIEDAYDARPEDPQIIDSMGFALYMEGDYNSALEYFERALERIPNDPTVNEHLGDTYWQLGRKTEAGYQWQRALDNKPEEENKKELLKKLANGIPMVKPANPQEAKKPSKSQVQ